MSSVPQDSHFGPVLLSLFVNDLARWLLTFNELLVLVQNSNPSCILITETKLTSQRVDALSCIDGYSIIRDLKDSVFKPFTITRCQFNSPGCECVGLKIHSFNLKFCLPCIYRPPSTTHADNITLFSSIETLYLH